jgi:hypothetical protein
MIGDKKYTVSRGNAGIHAYSNSRNESASALDTLRLSSNARIAGTQIFGYQNRLAHKLLRNRGTFTIYKTTRSGCTMSLIKACCELGKKVVIFTPTLKILKQIEEDVPRIATSKSRIAPILSNPELCRKLEPNQKLKFQFKENCSTCELKDKPHECTFQELMMEDFDIYCLTYSKLQALQKSTSKEAVSLLEKLRKCRAFIFDEFTSALTGHIPTIVIVTTDENGNLERTSQRIRTAFKEQFNLSDKIISESLYEKNSVMFKEEEFWGIFIEYFLVHFESIEKSGVYNNVIADFLPEEEMKDLFHYGWSKITKLTKEGKDTTELQDIFLVSFAKEIVVSCEDGTTKITPRLEDALGYIGKFCGGISEDKLIVVVDSYQPRVKFDHVFGREVKHFFWGKHGDPLGTNRQQLIVCDTAHWGALDFLKDKKLQERVRSFINTIMEAFSPNQVLIVTTNKKMASVVAQWNLPKDARVTWFRSDWMRGVSVEDRRVMICVGGPYIPKKAYDASAKSFRIESFAANLDLLEEDAKRLAVSRILRLDDTRSEFINAVGRVKDPEAKERSIVFTLGMQSPEVHTLLRQEAPVSKPHVVRPYAMGGLGRDGLLFAQLWQSREEIDIESLPVVARIIRYANDKKRVSASQVIHRKTKLVVEKAREYRDILRKYGVRIVSKQGGLSFEAC